MNPASLGRADPEGRGRIQLVYFKTLQTLFGTRANAFGLSLR